ncbi:MAG: DUF4440 domain-containing protein [Cellvibrio sp. 79]|nr:MAG: DUF4440 domain-containing protein [Cellvibrio sp. 79]
MNQQNPFLQVVAAYEQAVFTKNVEAFTGLYTKDVHIFDMWGEWSIQGLDNWRAMAEGWFSSLETERVVVTSEVIDSTITDELAVGYAYFTYTAIAENGEKLRSLTNRVSMALRKIGDNWKIFHEHTSAPIDHQSLQAILQRQPGK